MIELAQAIGCVTAITAVTWLETQALRAGINGKVFALSLATIAALGGYCVHDLITLL